MNLLSCRQIRSYQFSAEAAAMILDEVFERFTRNAPLSVMAQGIMGQVPHDPDQFCAT